MNSSNGLTSRSNWRWKNCAEQTGLIAQRDLTDTVITRLSPFLVPANLLGADCSKILLEQKPVLEMRSAALQLSFLHVILPF